MATTSRRRAPRADDDDISVSYLGIGSLGALAEPEETDEPPAIWLPLHRSGSPFGGWYRRILAPERRPIGFRRP